MPSMTSVPSDSNTASMFWPLKALVSKKGTLYCAAMPLAAEPTFLGRNDPLHFHVALVADENDPGVPGRELVDLVHPLLHALKRPAVRYGVGQDYAVRGCSAYT